VKPYVFIGSSSEGLTIANAIQQGLQRYTYPKVWTQGVFDLSSITIDALLEQVAQNDFGVFVLTPDDIAQIRTVNYLVARDNVFLESSLFMGRYGRERVFLVKPMGPIDLHIPTDLLGMSFAVYDAEHAKRDPRAAVGSACTDIVHAIGKVPRYVSDLSFRVSLSKGGRNYPAKVWVDITNHGSMDVVLRANYFKYKATLRRAPNANPVGNPDSEEFEFCFPGQGTHDQKTYLLRPGRDTNVWVGVDPTHSDDEINAAIKAVQVADLHMTAYWLGEKDVKTRYLAPEI
jgi:hypothetical protein